MNLHDQERESTLAFIKAIHASRMKKGDVPGHEFHGNQYTGGVGGTLPPGRESMFARLSQPGGGFTYQVVSGEDRKVGYAVSIYPERSFAKPAAEISRKDFARYIAQNYDLLKTPGNYLGGWHDGDSGMIFLDVSVVKDTEKEAAKLCHDHDQKGYYVLHEGREVIVNRNATSGGVAKKGDMQNEYRTKADIHIAGQQQDIGHGRGTGVLCESDRRHDATDTGRAGGVRRDSGRGTGEASDKLLGKGDIDGHEFHGNQYVDSVAGVGEAKSYNDLARHANSMSFQARQTNDARIHQQAADAHRQAANIAQRSLSTRGAVLTHLRLADHHEAQAKQYASVGAASSGATDEATAMHDLFAARRAGR